MKIIEVHFAMSGFRKISFCNFFYKISAFFFSFCKFRLVNIFTQCHFGKNKNNDSNILWLDLEKLKTNNSSLLTLHTKPHPQQQIHRRLGLTMNSLANRELHHYHLPTQTSNTKHVYEQNANLFIPTIKRETQVAITIPDR